MSKDTVTIEVPAGSTVLVNGKEVDTKPEFISRFTHGEYVLYSNGNICHGINKINYKFYRKHGKTYLTRTDSEREAKREELETRWLTRIAQLNYEHGCVCDWEDEHQFKVFVNLFNHKYSRVLIATDSCIQKRSTEHYFCPEAKEQLLSEFTDEEIKTIYFGEIG